MAYSLNGSTNYIDSTAAPVTAVPLTLAGWFYFTTDTVNGVIIAIDSTGGTHRWQLSALGLNVGDPIAAQCIAATTSEAFSSTGFSVNTWTHGCAVFNASGGSAIYINGGSKVTASSVPTPSGMNNLSIGCRWSGGSRAGFFQGRLAEVGVWNAELNDSEALSLARGRAPNRVRPDSLKFYAPLVRQLIELKGATLNNSGATVADHPRIYR